MPKRKRGARTIDAYVERERQRSTEYLSNVTPEYREWLTRQAVKRHNREKEKDSA